MQTAWDRQRAALRDPAEVLCGAYAADGLSPDALRVSADAGFLKLLRRLKLTLFVTREYEHLVMALSTRGTKLHQSFVHLPHPSGLVVDRRNASVTVAATRNPNQIWEFRPTNGHLSRTDVPRPEKTTGTLLPVRTKLLSGAQYLHDLALIGGKLYGNSVGQNAVVRIDMDRTSPPSIAWWPKCLEQGKSALHGCNYLQLNSIAAGPTLAQSFFSASGDAPGKHRPGHPDYPVDRRGVIFSGRTRSVAVRGLTRPHSARLAHGRLWVDNSGYGEFGYGHKGVFKSLIKLPGWTRGLCIVGDVAFVGVSRVIAKFRQYAPGVDADKAECGIYAVSLKTGKILGRCRWPNGNQIFAIDWILRDVSDGFPFTEIAPSSEATSRLFYSAVAGLDA